MSLSLPCQARSGAALLLLLCLAWPAGRTRADSLTLRFEPSYDAVETTTTDQGGTERHTSSNALTQRYFLSLDKSLFPKLRLGGSGIYHWTLGSASGGDGPPSESEARRWNLDARLTAGDPFLSGVAYYTRSQRSSRSMSDGLVFTDPTFESDVVGFSGLWRPDGLPQLQLLFTRSSQRDRDRRLSDGTTNQAVAQALYRPDPRVDLRARLAYTNPVDHLSGTEVRTFGEEARASYGDDYFDRRLALYASYILNASQSRVTAPGTGGTVSVQRFPVAGLSTVEALPEVPAKVALKPNGQLIDADTEAGAGVNIGFGPSTTGDTAYRDVGVQLADAITRVNLIYLWVNKPLPAAVAGAFSWQAYQSDDNLNWTPVPLAGPVAFGLFQNRFEIPIQATQARNLKVVTRPLAVGVTLDQQYATILVTEVQLYETSPAGSGSSGSSLNGQLNASSRLQLIRSHLSYDLSFSLAHAKGRSPLWNVSNGMVFTQRLSRILDLGARAERSDGSDGRGSHTAATRWSASLTADPLPALGGSLSYSGDWNETQAGSTFNNNFGLFARLLPYQDVSLYGSLSYSVNRNETGRTQRSETATAGATVTPNPKLSLSGNYLYSRSVQSGGGQPGTSADTWRVEGTASYNPFPALYASAGASRVNIAGVGQTLVNLAGSLSPFPGGNLVLSFRYNQSIDTLSDSRSRTFGPYLRWNLRTGLFVESSYTLLDTSLPAQETSTRALNVRLTLAL